MNVGLAAGRHGAPDPAELAEIRQRLEAVRAARLAKGPSDDGGDRGLTPTELDNALGDQAGGTKAERERHERTARYHATFYPDRAKIKTQLIATAEAIEGEGLFVSTIQLARRTGWSRTYVSKLVRQMVADRDRRWRWASYSEVIAAGKGATCSS
jgi:hypothetical protein